MKFKKQTTFLIILSIILVTVFVVDTQVETESSPHDLVISGLVDHPLNFTYSELQRFPMVSEVALMKCIGGWTQLYNWTGIPLFFLLSMTGVKAGATEVVFYASDGFSSSITIERALHPTTLLALQANGTVLSPADGYPYRLVVPCKYGYKWVKWITEIEVVDYDYKGTYESRGFSDEADRPNCTLPSTTPPFETFHIVRFHMKGNTTHSIITLSNSTINSFDFDPLPKQICFNITGPPSTKGYFYVIIPKELLWCDNPEQWKVWVNNTLIEDRKVIEAANYTSIYFTYNHSTQEVRIKGVHVTSIVPDDCPTIQEAVNAASSGDTVYVRAGTYYENVVLNKIVSLIGQNRSTTIIDGNGTTGNGVKITASNVTIRGFTIKNHGLDQQKETGNGIYVYGSISGISITDNVIVNNTNGVFLRDYPFGSSVIGNVVTNNNCEGVYFDGASDNVIKGNLVTDGNHGVLLEDSSNNTIVENMIVNNQYGIDVHSYSIDNIVYHNSFINNTNQAFLESSTSSAEWDNGCEGNYWSNYNGSDLNLPPDGIGDEHLPWEGVDYYPLMSPYMEGDVNHDARVSIHDIVTVAIAFGSEPGDPYWNPHADLNEDKIISIVDIVIVAIHFGEKWDWDRLQSRRF